MRELYPHHEPSPQIYLRVSHPDVAQYWRSIDHLVDYAQSKAAVHLPAWKTFDERVGNDGTVGIWHETYQVAAGRYERVHVNMPRFGILEAGTPEPATGHLRDARARMNAPKA